MKIYYRISDKSHQKEKLPGTNKQFCYRNFLAFPNKEDHMIIIADNCELETISWLEFDADVPCRQFNIQTTNLGNAGSIIHCIKDVIESESFDDEVIYFVEDDYLHLPESRETLLEGFQFGDYVTLYDHPDKYTKRYDYGELCKVMKGNLSHWRSTQSTCMTFASKVKTLKEDFNIWEKWTKDNIPHDHKIFTELSEGRKNLVVCIPGMAIHADLTDSIFEGKPLIEDWAIDIAISELKKDIEPDILFSKIVGVDNTDRWEYLKRIQAYRYARKLC